MKIVNLSCIMFMYLVICCKKFPIFYDKPKDRKDYEKKKKHIKRATVAAVDTTCPSDV